MISYDAADVNLKVNKAIEQLIEHKAESFSEGDPATKQLLVHFGRLVVDKVRRQVYGESNA